MHIQSFSIGHRHFKVIACLAVTLPLLGCPALNIQPDQEIPSDKTLVFARTVLKAEKKWLPGFERIDLGFEGHEVGEKASAVWAVDAVIRVTPGETVYATAVEPGRYSLILVGATGGSKQIQPGTYNPVEAKAGVANYIGTYEIVLDWPRFSIYLNRTCEAFERAVTLFRQEFRQKHGNRPIVYGVVPSPDRQSTTDEPSKARTGTASDRSGCQDQDKGDSILNSAT